MKYIHLILAAVILSSELNAQNYMISFAGIGASLTVSSVKVENLTTGTTINLNGNDILNLTFATGIDSKLSQSPLLKIYPNPMTDQTLLEIRPPSAGDAIISIYDITGKQVAKILKYLDNSVQGFRLSGINHGLYLIDVKSSNYHFSAKLLSNLDKKGIINIEKIDIFHSAIEEKNSDAEKKGTQETFSMSFTDGDRLRFTATSGIYMSVVNNSPTSDKTITFKFVDCIDGDDNCYSQVAIGNQVWMAENLKTTKFSDGTSIQLVESLTEWSALSSTAKAYCYYNNSESLAITYGALYTWPAAVNGSVYSDTNPSGIQGVCPVGWHLPSFQEYKELASFLGGLDLAGGQMKETGTAHWNLPNAYANNASGFCALPAGRRYKEGGFLLLNEYTNFWTTTESCDPCNPSSFFLSYLERFLAFEGSTNPKEGLSVRCVKD